ncbi:hypothetical protein DFJ43DRAFT_1157072 [Lentinula guzmanii]|uniref:Uncharacterized protein n=1 Tax=Lentinula guzmanii TaxID=2804957 RepID=A0AA38MXN8_9AGAR|nr:hypothetical protein DFJ43DRAFT_1157072 [Lentinula guzmanii]
MNSSLIALDSFPTAVTLSEMPNPSPEEQEVLDRLNLYGVDPLFRVLKEDDLVPTGINPFTEEITVSLDGVVSACLWKSLIDLVKLVFRAGNTAPGGVIRPEYLNVVGMTLPPSFSNIVRFHDSHNPLGYSIPRLQAEWNFYTAQRMLRELVNWISTCQYRCYKFAEAGIDPLWAWTQALTTGVVPPPDTFVFTFGSSYPGTTRTYDPRLPGFDPRLLEYVLPSQEVVLHPIASHYAQHYPGFNAFTRDVLVSVPDSCTGDVSCLGLFGDDLNEIQED